MKQRTKGKQLKHYNTYFRKFMKIFPVEKPTVYGSYTNNRGFVQLM